MVPLEQYAETLLDMVCEEIENDIVTHQIKKLPVTQLARKAFFEALTDENCPEPVLGRLCVDVA